MNPEARKYLAAIGQLGGQAKSAAKASANRAKAAQFWADVRAGERPAPKRRNTRMARRILTGHRANTPGQLRAGQEDKR